MLKSRVDHECGLHEGDLLIPIRQFVVFGGYEYEIAERISDGQRYKFPLERIGELFDHVDNDDLENS